MRFPEVRNRKGTEGGPTWGPIYGSGCLSVCLGLPYWHHQLVLFRTDRQTDRQTSEPIDRTPGIPVVGVFSGMWGGHSWNLTETVGWQSLTVKDKFKETMLHLNLTRNRIEIYATMPRLQGCGPSGRLWALRACLITSFRPCDPRINAMIYGIVYWRCVVFVF